jgi:hypothetical protein
MCEKEVQNTYTTVQYINFFLSVLKMWLGEPPLIVLSLIECRGSIQKFSTFLYNSYKIVAEFCLDHEFSELIMVDPELSSGLRK